MLASVLALLASTVDATILQAFPLPGPKTAADVPDIRRIAVTPFGVSDGVPEILGAVVADVLVSAIDAEDVELVERQRIGRVLDEQAFAASGLTQPGDAVRIGRIADIRWILIGDLYRVDGVYVVSGRLVDAETGTIHEEARGSVQFRTVDQMPARMGDLAAALGLRRSSVDGGATRGSTGVEPGDSSALGELAGIVSGEDPFGLRLAVQPGGDVVRVGTALNAEIEVDAAGFLTLLAVDAGGRISRLVPNDRLPELQVMENRRVRIPSDLGFRLVVRPPLGPTRFKAIVTERPLSLGDDTIDSAALAARLAGRDWSSAETEFLVVSSDGTLPERLDREEADGVEGEGPVDSPETESTADDQASIRESDIRDAYQRWLLGDRNAQVLDHLAWWETACSRTGDGKRGPDLIDVSRTPLVAVIDADFDPDDDWLELAFSDLDPDERESLRNEIRRHGRVGFRHGNRVAALLAGDQDRLASACPGCRVLPIPVTSVARGSVSRIRIGGADEILEALREAAGAEARIINLSLCIRLDGDDLARFRSDPIWDRLEADEIVVVCAAGNDGKNRDLDPVFPAGLDRSNIVVVTATGPDGGLLDTAAHGRVAVDIAAPGGPLFTSDGGGVGVLASGTSYATALVSGAVASVLATEPGISASSAIERILRAAEMRPELADKVRHGTLRWPG